MLNWFKVRKWGALIFNPFLCVTSFFIGIKFYNFWLALGLFLFSCLAGTLLGIALLKNPFTDMIEGTGILTINLDSTGVLKPFIVSVNSPYIKGFLDKKPVNDVFDRNAVFNLSPPKKVKNPIIKDEKGITIKLTHEELNAGRFGLWHYPTLIYNEQIKSILTKDFLSNSEKEIFAEHGVLYLNRKMEELTSVVRDFGRYVVELTKPKEGWLLNNKWILIIAAVLIGLLVIMFLPKVIQQLGGSIPNIFGGLKGATSGGAITPIQ